MLEVKHPLILGSSGVVGKALVDEYTNKKDVTPLRYDISANPHHDLRKDKKNLKTAMEVCDFVFFLAYDVGGAKFLDKNKNNISLIQNNSRMMDNVFGLLQKTGKPFIFASSQMSNMLHSSYGVCKALGEHYTKAIGGKYVKFWNVYGPEHDEEKAHVITDFINNALNKNKIEMRTNGYEKRQFLHTQDCGRCLATLAEKYDDIQQEDELDITSFEWSSIIEIAKIVANKIPNTEVIPGIKKDMTQLDRQNEPKETILKYWKPEISLEQGIDGLIELYKNE